jgi:Sec-independent protein secretion pathway component TatC
MGDVVRLSVLEIVVQCVAVFVVAPVAAAVLTPSVDAISLAICWLGLVALFEAGFFAVWWLRRRGR